MVLVLLAVLGCVLLLGPIGALMMGTHLPSLVTLICMFLGVLLIFGTTIVAVISKLYVRANTDMALIRTGLGGLRIIKDGGTLYIPVIHSLTKVLLKTIKVGVERKDGDALITLDKLRADISAEFFVKVMPTDESITGAGRSFGSDMTVELIRKLIEDKLVNALRQVAATRTLEDLNSKRDEFMGEVRGILTEDLRANGLTLETATISRLDQTNPASLRDNNIFDSQGKRTISAITQSQLTERNRIERDNERLRAQTDVETRQQILQLEQQRAQADLEQKTAIATIQAKQTQLTQQRALEAEQEVALSKVQQAQNLQLAQIQQAQMTKLAQTEQDRLIAEAQIQQEQGVRLAKIAQTQRIEIADQDRSRVVAEAERAKAVAETERARAVAEQTKANQAILFLEVEAKANRDKTQRTIEAEALAGQKLIEAQRAADASAYKLCKDAEAQKVVASAMAEATLLRAQADSQAQTLNAEGQRAVSLIPVQIAKEQVEVEKQRVDVLRQEMQARTEHGATAQQFELAKLKIEAEAKVQIATAGAMATLLGKVQANVYGTPEDVAKMTDRFAKGMGLTQMLEGARSGMSEEVSQGLEKIVADVAHKVLGPTQG